MFPENLSAQIRVVALGTQQSLEPTVIQLLIKLPDSTMLILPLISVVAIFTAVILLLCGTIDVV